MYSIVGKRYGTLYRGRSGTIKERFWDYEEFCCQHKTREEAEEFVQSLTSECKNLVLWEGEIYASDQVFILKYWPVRRHLRYNITSGKIE